MSIRGAGPDSQRGNEQAYFPKCWTVHLKRNKWHKIKCNNPWEERKEKKEQIERMDRWTSCSVSYSWGSWQGRRVFGPLSFRPISSEPCRLMAAGWTPHAYSPPQSPYWCPGSDMTHPEQTRDGESRYSKKTWYSPPWQRFRSKTLTQRLKCVNWQFSCRDKGFIFILLQINMTYDLENHRKTKWKDTLGLVGLFYSSRHPPPPPQHKL